MTRKYILNSSLNPRKPRKSPRKPRKSPRKPRKSPRKPKKSSKKPRKSVKKSPSKRIFHMKILGQDRFRDLYQVPAQDLYQDRFRDLYRDLYRNIDRALVLEAKKKEYSNKWLNLDEIKTDKGDVLITEVSKSGFFGETFFGFLGFIGFKKIPVAIKIQTSNMQDEIKISMDISEKNIDGIPVYFTSGKIGYYYFLVMERLGDTLQTVIDRQTESIDWIGYGIQLITILKSLNDNGYCHGDLDKPGNILFGLGDKNKKLYLIDFMTAGPKQKCSVKDVMDVLNHILSGVRYDNEIKEKVIEIAKNEGYTLESNKNKIDSKIPKSGKEYPDYDKIIKKMNEILRNIKIKK